MMATTLEDTVKQRAFELYLSRGEKHGNDQEDWFLAEQEVRGKNDNVKAMKLFTPAKTPDKSPNAGIANAARIGNSTTTTKPMLRSKS
jgi:hypothetical protein